MPHRTFRINLQRGRRLVTSLAAAFLLAIPAIAAAAPFLPPPGKTFQGVAGQPVSSYQRAIKHPAVYQEFVAWGQWLPGITQDAISHRARLMMLISTKYGSSEAITPGAIADGRGDGWLIGLNRAIYDSGNVTYVRPMAEMDAHWNPYSAYNADGSPRDSAHSSGAFSRAWKRVTLIMRGGSLGHIDAVLKRLGMPSLHAGADLPRPKVAMLWVPQVAGAPDRPGNEPRDYWPGKNWVDWIGTDFYSNAPNFGGLNALYNAYPQFPFVFGEYALWDSGDDVGFVSRLLRWARSHPRARMLIYNQGVNAVGPFRLYRYPGASDELRRLLAGPQFPAFAPEWR
jgi:hypothetical protein